MKRRADADKLIFEIVKTSSELDLSVVTEAEIEEMQEISELREIVADIGFIPFEFHTST